MCSGAEALSSHLGDYRAWHRRFAGSALLDYPSTLAALSSCSTPSSTPGSTSSPATLWYRAAEVPGSASRHHFSRSNSVLVSSSVKPFVSVDRRDGQPVRDKVSHTSARTWQEAIGEHPRGNSDAREEEEGAADGDSWGVNCISFGARENGG